MSRPNDDQKRRWPHWFRTWLLVFSACFLFFALGLPYLLRIPVGRNLLSGGLLEALLFSPLLATLLTYRVRVNGGAPMLWVDRFLLYAACPDPRTRSTEGTERRWRIAARLFVVSWLVIFAIAAVSGLLNLCEIAIRLCASRSRPVPWGVVLQVWLGAFPFFAAFAGVSVAMVAGGGWLLACTAPFLERAAERRRAQTAPRIHGAAGDVEVCGISGDRVLGRLTRSETAGLRVQTGSLRAGDLSGLDLRGAGLAGVDLRGALLRKADLEGADLSGADLRRANLSQASLRGAKLRAADLRSATLVYTDLRGVELSGALLGPDRKLPLVWPALLYGADLRGAKWDETTRWPPGFDPERHIAALAREVEPAEAPEGEGSEVSTAP